MLEDVISVLNVVYKCGKRSQLCNYNIKAFGTYTWMSLLLVLRKMFLCKKCCIKNNFNKKISLSAVNVKWNDNTFGCDHCCWN